MYVCPASLSARGFSKELPFLSLRLSLTSRREEKRKGNGNIECLQPLGMRLHRIRISYYLSEANVLSLSSTAPYTASLRFVEGGKGRPREMPTLLRVFVRKPPHPRHSLAGPWRVEKLLLIIAAARMESALPQRTVRKTSGKDKKKKKTDSNATPSGSLPTCNT